MKLKIGIIGGTGLDQDTELLQDKREVTVPTTKYGDPSDTIVIEGTLSGVPVAIMGRHGRNHSINPSNVNYRANLWTLKHVLGCNVILVTSACGSLKEEIKPGDLGIFDQYIDRTCGGRERSYYAVSHIGQAAPYDPKLQRVLEESCKEAGFTVHPNLTAVCIEGPRFSTLAESKLYRNWGADLVNMTTVPETQLAGELGIPYASLALVTDYDCWHVDEHECVTVELVTERLRELSKKAKKVLAIAVKKVAQLDLIDHIKTKEEQARAAIMLP